MQGQPPFDPGQVTAAVLAGGAGARLDGLDKGLQLLLDRPLVAHVLEGLRGQVGAIVLCINRNHLDYSVFAPVLVDTEKPFQGPLAGIAAALAKCATPWLLTVPVDSPRPPGDLAERLHRAVVVAKRESAVAHTGERRQPLFALYSRRMYASARAALANDLAVWRWQDEINAADVDFSDSRGAFANLNTAEDFRRWEQDHHA